MELSQEAGLGRVAITDYIITLILLYELKYRKLFALPQHGLWVGNCLGYLCDTEIEMRSPT